MSFIERVDVPVVVKYYEIDIESVTIFPHTREIEVKLYRRFYNDKNELVRTEKGEIEKLKGDFSDITEKVREIMKERKKDKK